MSLRDAPTMPIANSSPLEPTGARPPRCEIGKAATVTSGVAEAEVAAQVCPVVVVRRAILYEREEDELHRDDLQNDTRKEPF